MIELYKAGFGIAIDGFGAGYTSVPRATHIPVDAVKLDRSLTEGLLAHASDSSVLASATADVDEVSAAEASSASAVPSSMSAAATSAPDTASEAVTSAADEAITGLINLVHEAGKIVVVEGVEHCSSWRYVATRAAMWYKASSSPSRSYPRACYGINRQRFHSSWYFFSLAFLAGARRDFI